MKTTAPTASEIDRASKRALRNLVDRINSGHVPTPREIDLLARAGGGSVDGAAWAKNFVELARAVGVTRQTIHRYARRKDSPKPSSNGSHDVVAWRIYLAKHGAIEDPEKMPDKTVLEAQLLHLRVALSSIELEERKREVVSMKEHLAKLQHLAGVCAGCLKSLPSRISAITRDPAIIEKVRTECESAQRSILASLEAPAPYA